MPLSVIHIKNCVNYYDLAERANIAERVVNHRISENAIKARETLSLEPNWEQTDLRAKAD